MSASTSYAKQLLISAFCACWLSLAPNIFAQCSPQCALTSAPIAVDFGNKLLGSSTVQTVTLNNLNDVGALAVNVSQLVLQNAPSSITRIGGTCSATPFALTSGASCTMALSFAPTVVGVQSATLQVVADTGNFTVAVSGTGIVAAPLPTFAPAQLNFGLSPIGGNGVTQTLTITNPGAAPLALLGLTGASMGTIPGSGNYQVVGGSCVSLPASAVSYVFNTPLAAGASCTVQVMFQAIFAQTPANLDSTLVIQTGAGNVSIPMIASVGPPTQALTRAPSPLDFGNRATGSTTMQSITLTNPGPATVNVQASSFIAATAAITRSGGTCPASPFALTSGASCTMALSFAPTVVGVQSATLQVVADTGNFTVAVSGTGIVAAPLPTFAPAQLNFGLSPIGGNGVTQTLTITNPGAAPLALLGLTGASMGTIPGSGNYQVVGGSCVSLPASAVSYVFNTPLAAGASCTVQVMFQAIFAQTPANLDSTLVIQTGAGNVSIPMIASVGPLTYPIIVSPGVVTFSSTSATAESRTVTFTNPAPVTAIVTSFVVPVGYSRVGGTCANAPISLPPAASCTVILSRNTPTALANSHLKAASYIDVPIVATTGNVSLRIELASQPLVNMTVATQPAGLRLVINGQPRTTPVALQVEAGTSVSIEARAQNLGSTGYAFASWSDSGNAVHVVVAQNPASTLTARFSAIPIVAKLDVDNDGLVNPATDGILVVRYLLGMRGAALIDGLPIPANAERRDAASITAYLDAIRTDLDVDGVGGASAMTDGILIVRYMLGLTGTALMQGASAVGAQSPTQIQNKLDAMRP